METVTRKVIKPNWFTMVRVNIKRCYINLKINTKHWYGIIATKVYKATNYTTEGIHFRMAKIKQWISNFPYTYKDIKPKPGYKGSDPLIKGFDL